MRMMSGCTQAMSNDHTLMALAMQGIANFPANMRNQPAHVNMAKLGPSLMITLFQLLLQKLDLRSPWLVRVAGACMKDGAPATMTYMTR